MSTLKVNNLQVGQDGTAANNYTLYQPAVPDGTVRLGYGVSGSVTDILTLKNSRLGIGTNDPGHPLDVRSSVSDSGISLGRPGQTPNFIVYNNGGQNSSRMILRHDGSNIIEFRADGAGSYINSGNFGIGTDTPGTKLDILNGSDAAVIATINGADTSSEYLGFGVNGTSALITAGGNGSTSTSLVFRTANSGTESERLYITSGGSILHLGNGTTSNPAITLSGTAPSDTLVTTSTGKVGIGTDNPVGSLEVRDSKANLIVAKDGLTVKSNSDLHTTYDTLQIGAGGALLSYSTATATADTQFVHNAYRSSGGTFKYRYADTAARIRMNSPGGEIIFDNAASGSADADITFSERLRIDSSGRLLKSGQAALTSTSLSHPIQIAADSSAQNIACFGRASDDISAINFYEADKTTNLGEIQYRQDHVNFRHRVGYISFATGGVTESLRITTDKQIHLGNGGFGTTKVGGQEITGQDTSATLKLYDTRADMWGMQMRRDTGTGPNGIFVRAGNTSSNYSLYVCGTTESNTHLVCRGDNRVGIGTDSPDTSLTVNGSINVETGVFGKRFTGSTTVDTGLMVGTTGTFSHAVIEVIVSGNPNHFGSGYYRASSTYLVHIGTGWTGSALSTIINATRVSYGVGGSGNSSEVTATFVLYNSSNSTEYSSGAARNSNHQLRVKIAGCSTSSGARCFVKVLSNDSWLA